MSEGRGEQGSGRRAHPSKGTAQGDARTDDRSGAEAPRGTARVLAINTGSSSLKAAVYRPAAPSELERAVFGVLVDRIGAGPARLRVSDASGAVRIERDVEAPDFEAALHLLRDALLEVDPQHRLCAIGHRLVHGGSRFERPVLIGADTLDALDALVPLAPEHMPQALIAVRHFARAAPAVPQVACFDTTFHRTLPLVAQTISLPRDYREQGFVRYGFHGLSYESAVTALRALDAGAADGRLVVLHLGNGASMAAIRDGRSIDTTMGYTPTSGLMMGTRSGDIDPGVLIELMRRGMSADEIAVLLNERSGLLGVSGMSGDMRDLLAASATDPRAGEAIDLFVYRAQKYLGAFASVLGGIDTIVFTGGIGEKSAVIRARICAGQSHLGIALDDAANAMHAVVVSAFGVAVTVRVISADEEAVIARHTLAQVASRQPETAVA